MSLTFNLVALPLVEMCANSTECISTNHFLYMLDFLNTNRITDAQNAAGISFQTFLSSLSISLICCVFQVVVFSLLRTKWRNIYQSNCFFTRLGDRLDEPLDGLFSWVTDIFKEPMVNYKRVGLDAYFFLRYLAFLFFLFLGLAVMNLPVLIPVNYLSGYQSYTLLELDMYTNGTVPIVEGLDMISMSNIAPKYTRRLSIHLTMTVISVLWFHVFLTLELRNYVKIKNEFFADESNFTARNKFRDYNNTILVQNVPPKYLNRNELVELFGKLCGARVKNIWFVYDYGEMRQLYKKEMNYMRIIESLLTREIYNKFFLLDSPLQKTHTYKALSWRHSIRQMKFWRFRFDKEGILPKKVVLQIPVLVSRLQGEMLANRVRLHEKRSRFIARDHSPLLDHRYNKVFVQFKDPLHSEMLSQIQISGKLNELDKVMTLINPRDIVWDNMSVQSNMCNFMRVTIANSLACLMILGWTIPVAFFGLISQVPMLSSLIPFLSWLKMLPSYITDVISNYLSVILLMGLSELVPHIFRWISWVKGKLTGAEVELDVQRWMFVFLFFHIFLVVTISSGYTKIVEGLVNNPVSVPNILATNLPKCSNFFFSYIAIRGFSYFGNNILQNYELFCNMVIYPWIDWTPREKFERLTRLPVYKWGSIYPTVAVLGSIGLIYSILSPLIVVFCCLTFSLFFFSFKYTLKYEYDRKNVSENYGQFYPVALFQLYSGVYFMEACLIGMFALSRNENGEADCIYHACLAFLLLIATAAGHVQLQQMFGRLISKICPLTLTRSATVLDEQELKSSDGAEPLFNDTFYEPCFQHMNNIIWLPKDYFNITLQEITRLSSLNIEATSSYTEMTDTGAISLYGGPPDLIDND